jgi:hypothetical protein
MLALMTSGASKNLARTDEELAFLHSVEFGDVTSVRCLMSENPHLNVDVIDALGRSALRLAVRIENKEVGLMRVFLQR